MNIIQICLIGIITGFSYTILRAEKSDIAFIVLLAGIIIISLSVVDYFTEIIKAFKNIIIKSNLNNDIFKLIFKIVIIGYIIDFSAGIIEETGSKGLSEKVIIGGKIVVMTMFLPIIIKLFDFILGLLQ